MMKKDEDEKKERLPDADTESIMEEMRGGFGVFAEEFILIYKEIGSLKKDIYALKSDIENMLVKFGDIQNDPGEKIDSADRGQEEPLAKEDVSMLKADVIDIRMQLAEIAAKLNDRADENVVYRHEKRLAKIERIIRTM